MKRLSQFVGSVIVVLGLAASAPGLAAPDLVERLTVKIRSGVRSDFKLPFAGSGVLFRHGQDVYALTSEHAVLHGNGRFSHAVFNQHLGTVGAMLAAADWGSGIALLKIDSKNVNPAEFPGIEIFSPETPLKNAPVWHAGFPHQIESLIDSRGSVLLPQSERHAIPLVSSLVEAVGAHGEFGMSGGPVFDETRSKVVGLLSHQYIELVPGGRSKVSEYEASNLTIQNHVLIIPSGRVLEWVKRYLFDPSGFRASFVRDPELQLTAKTQVVFSGDLRFEFIAPVVAPVLAPAVSGQAGQKTGGGIGGTDGTGIGGADATGIGGSDGVGIGGTDAVGLGGTQSAANSRTGIVVSRAMGLKLMGSSLEGLAETSWTTHVRRKLQGTKEVAIPFVVRKSADGAKATKVGFNSVGEFMSLAAGSDVVPLAFAVNESAISGSDDEKRLKDAGKRLGLALDGISKADPKFFGSEGRALLKSLSLVSEAIVSTDWVLVLDEKLLSGIEGERDAWDGLFNVAFEESIALLKALRDVREAMHVVSGR